MAGLSLNGVRYATVFTGFLLIVALALGTFSMFYVGWIKYTVSEPTAPSTEFQASKEVNFTSHSRVRGLFYYIVDDKESKPVKDNDNSAYFPVMYNYKAGTKQPPSVGFWSITAIMKASVGLHVAFLVLVALSCWLVSLSNCCGGRALVFFSLAINILGLVSGGLGLALFHIYIEMERSSNIPALPDIWYHWLPELKEHTAETLDVSWAVHIGSLGAAALSLLLIILIASSWPDKKEVEENAPSDKVNIYTRDNLAYDDTLADKPARSELWNGFDKISEKRVAMERNKLRASYPRDHEPSADYGHSHHHHHHPHYHHHTAERGDDRLDRVNTPTRQHYHADPTNYPLRY